MEEEMIPLRHRLKYMVGVRFDLTKYAWNGVTVARGWYVFFGFYWFAFAFFRIWPLEFIGRCASGMIFSYKPNPDLREGDPMWANNKKWLRFTYQEDIFHATKMR